MRLRRQRKMCPDGKQDSQSWEWSLQVGQQKAQKVSAMDKTKKDFLSVIRDRAFLSHGSVHVMSGPRRSSSPRVGQPPPSCYHCMRLLLYDDNIKQTKFSCFYYCFQIL